MRKVRTNIIVVKNRAHDLLLYRRLAEANKKSKILSYTKTSVYLVLTNIQDPFSIITHLTSWVTIKKMSTLSH